MSEVEQKNCCPVVISKDQIIPGTEFYDMWNVGSAPDYKAQVPIFSVYNMHGLNAIIGDAYQFKCWKGFVPRTNKIVLR